MLYYYDVSLKVDDADYIIDTRNEILSRVEKCKARVQPSDECDTNFQCDCDEFYDCLDSWLEKYGSCGYDAIVGLAIEMGWDPQEAIDEVNDSRYVDDWGRITYDLGDEYLFHEALRYFATHIKAQYSNNGDTDDLLKETAL